MRVVLDTNILVSALLGGARPLGSPPAALIAAWRSGRYHLVTAVVQMAELTEVLARPKIHHRLPAAIAQTLITDLNRLALIVEPIDPVQISPDPDDDAILAIAQTAQADYLVTGDKNDLLALGSFGQTRIVTARRFLSLLDNIPYS